MYKWQFKVFIAFGIIQVKVSITKNLLLCKPKEHRNLCKRIVCFEQNEIFLRIFLDVISLVHLFH